MAEAFFRQRCEQRGMPWAAQSVGRTFDGAQPPEEIVDAMARRGLDLSVHRSRRMAYGHVSGADLVIGMDRSHVRDVTMVLPMAFTRTFTLKEIVRRGEAIGPCAEPIDHWLAWLGIGRSPGDLVGSDAGDDVADPYRRSWRTYLGCATEIEDLTERLVDLLADARPASVLPPPDTPSEKI
jgi:protein-tyrosine phosphatase